MIFRRKRPTVIQLIKEISLDLPENQITFYCTVNGKYASNSGYKSQKYAEEFFNKLVELNGNNTEKTVLKQTKI